jgi:nitrite reductase/ring-hydroxylating ferredoxin subunit
MKRTQVCKSGDVVEGVPFSVKAGEHSLIVTRIKGKIQAISAKCPHLGMSMARGKISEGAIQCPWHGSRFDVCTGRNLDWVNSFAGIPMPKWSHKIIGLGKQPAAVATFESSEENGAVFVNL